MKFYKLILISLFFEAGFFCSAQSGVNSIDSVFTGGNYRKFRVYIPNMYDGTKPVPLILNFHGYTSNAAQQQIYSNFMAIADTANFIIAHPEGSTILGSQFWNTGLLSSPDDVLFTSDMISFLMAKYNIDFSRIYSCGMSNGGIMSYYLACNLPSRIAAIASVTGSMFNGWYTACDPGRPIPVMEIHGTADGVVPYNGSNDFSPIDSVVKKWVINNSCNPAITYSVTDVNLSDNSYVLNYRYTGGLMGSSVELYKVIGGGHAWPGSIPLFPNTNLDFNATVEIWRFFRQYKLTQFIADAGIEKTELRNEVIVFPNPSADRIFVKGIDVECNYKIYGVDGKELLTQTGENEINISGLTDGIYFLHVLRNERKAVFKIIKN